jgi:energy-coupling factor transporter ATP-binding protein EcfA2
MGTPLVIGGDLPLDLESLVGQCVAVLGIRGSGKSNTAGVIFEELLKHQYPLTIVDIDGEYYGLKERYEVLVAGMGEGVDVEVDVDCAPEIAQASMERNVPVILDLSGFLSSERTEFLKSYLSTLWNLAGKLRRPYVIAIEEAHEFIPQGVRTELKELITRVALRGRKRGLGAIIISQRSAKVEKDVLSQAGILFLHRVVHEADMRVYGELLPWRKSEVKELVSALETGDCIFVNGETVLPTHVRKRETFHAGFTPSLHVVVSPELRRVSESLLEAIGRRGGATSPEGTVAAKPRGCEEGDPRDEPLLVSASPDTRARQAALPAEARRPLEGGAVSTALLSPSSVPKEAPPAGPDVVQEPLPAGRASALAGPVGKDSEGPLPEAVRRHVERLVARLGRQTLLDRRFLAFLVGSGPRAYSAAQIAAWTDCAPGVIERTPPRDLLEMGLVVRERRTDGVHYRSNLKAFVAREFGVYRPQIGPQELSWVAQSLRERLATLGGTARSAP